MFSPALSERFDALIDELIMDGGVEAASLASILVAAKDSVKRDYLVSLSRRVWAANDELLSRYVGDAGGSRVEADSQVTPSDNRRHSGSK